MQLGCQMEEGVVYQVSMAQRTLQKHPIIHLQQANLVTVSDLKQHTSILTDF